MLAITDAKVFDGRNLLPGRHTVTVEANTITAIDGPVPAESTVIDASGMTLMPGLITSHLHSDFFKFNIADSDRLGKERPPGVLMAIGVRTCRVLLESGFTGYAGASCSNDIDAQLKMAIEEDIIPGPRIRACGHHIGTTGDMNNGGRWWKAYQTPGTDICADGPDALRTLVRQEINRGAETIKIFASAGHGQPHRTTRNMSRSEIASIIETAHERGAKVRAHVADKAMILECI
jgi:imidazolonepropionase-like amidohydrolase